MTRSISPDSPWFDIDRIRSLAETCNSKREIFLVLGLEPNTGQYRKLREISLIHNINMPTGNTNEAKSARLNSFNRISDEEWFAPNSSRAGQATIKRLVAQGVLLECSECGQLPIWNNKPLVLQLDHIDGNSTNNLKENVRILCGHCHSQTETFGNKNSLRKYNYCAECGTKVWKGSTKCHACSNRARALSNQDKKIVWPSIQELKSLYYTIGSWRGLAEHLGVSDNSIRKHLTVLGVNFREWRSVRQIQLNMT